MRRPVAALRENRQMWRTQSTLSDFPNRLRLGLLSLTENPAQRPEASEYFTLSKWGGEVGGLRRLLCRRRSEGKWGLQQSEEDGEGAYCDWYNMIKTSLVINYIKAV